MTAIFMLIDRILDLYLFFIFVWFIMGWLQMFGVLPMHNRYVQVIMEFLNKIIEPALRPLRRIIPLIGNIDLSPLVLYIGISFFKTLLSRDIAPALGVFY